MKMKKALCFMLAACMSMSMFSGCGKKKSAGVQDAGVPENLQVASPSWKTDTSPHTIKWFVTMDWYGGKFVPDTNEFDKWTLEETGITVEFSSGDEDKLNAMIQTGNMPDVITTYSSSSQRKMLEENNMLYPMNELVEKYAPDMFYPETEKEWYTASDGNWYALNSYYYGEDNVKDNNGFYETMNQNFVRKDICDQIGVDYNDLRTKEKFLDALRKVKEQKVTYQGLEVIPYMVTQARHAVQQLAEQFGAVQEDAEGNYVPVYRTKEYVEALQFLNTLYQEGLLTDLSMTSNQQAVREKIAAGQVFATTEWTNVSTRDTLTAADPNALMLYAGAMSGDGGATPMLSAGTNAGWSATFVNKTCNRPDRVAQFLSFLRSEEAIYNGMYGVGGWELVDGRIVRDPEYVSFEISQPSEYEAKYEGNMWIVDYTFIQGTFPLDDSEYGKDIDKRTHDDQIIIFDDKCFSEVSPQGGTDLAATSSKVGSALDKAYTDIVTTCKSPEEVAAKHEESLKQLDTLGVADLEAYQNEQFQANKKRLGLEFAHPANQK